MIISANADHRHSDYHFNRQQSRSLSQKAWETRTPPIQSYGDRALTGLLFGFVAGGFVLHLMGVW